MCLDPSDLAKKNAEYDAFDMPEDDFLGGQPTTSTTSSKDSFSFDFDWGVDETTTRRETVNAEKMKKDMRRKKIADDYDRAAREAI